jgi:hypothetical protein
MPLRAQRVSRISDPVRGALECPSRATLAILPDIAFADAPALGRELLFASKVPRRRFRDCVEALS